MKHKKDIGTLLQHKLDGKAIHAPERVWHRVRQNLEIRAKKRRRIILWASVSGLAVLVLIVLVGSAILTTPETPSPAPEWNRTPLRQKDRAVHSTTTNPLESQSNEGTRKTLKAAPEAIAQGADSTLRKTTLGKPKENAKKESSPEKPEQSLASLPSGKEKSIPSAPDTTVSKADSFQVKTIYHYYRSSDSTSHVIQSKKWIDSVVGQPMPTHKNDSLIDKDHTP